MFSDIKNSSGFTMIDLLIWLAIFGVLTGAMVANFRAGGRNDAVRGAAELVASTLRLAQSKTLTGEILANSDFPDGGWGAHFDSAAPSELVLFADTSIPSNYRYDEGEGEGEKIILPRGVVFSWAEEFPVLDIVFSPPDGKIYFNGDTAIGKITIDFSAAGSSMLKKVEILRLSGQIRTQ